MYLETIAEDDATGRIAEIYAKQKAQLGFVMNASRCLTARPDLLPLYTDFIDQLRGNFSLGLKAWRLITLVAAKHVPSTYCSYVYARQLVDDLGTREAVLAVHRDFRNAGLSAKEVEMLAYAEKIAKDASKVTERDIERLRRIGFGDREICDIALCASFRCFVSRLFDAVGAGPEPAFVDADEEFRRGLTVGKSP
ncbi:MAG TPA: alkylhydroperoxidase [Aestuariivirgaceae bacterium]|nr:alkylhydroperoxidase [Aestuariivirgaceae bacterium]